MTPVALYCLRCGDLMPVALWVARGGLCPVHVVPSPKRHADPPHHPLPRETKP